MPLFRWFSFFLLQIPVYADLLFGVLNPFRCRSFFLFWISLVSASQPALEYSFYTGQNGLPEDRVRQVLEGPDGTLVVLMGNEGLWRYDGRQFTPLPINRQLPSLFIQNALFDGQGRLWIACNYHGIWIYENGRVYPFSDNHLFENQHFTCLYRDDADQIWIGVNRVGLFRFDGLTCSQLSQGFSLPQGDILSIGKRDSRVILLVAPGILYSLNLQTGRCVRHPRVLVDDLIHFIITRTGALLTLEKSRGLVKYEKTKTEVLIAVDLRTVALSRLLEDEQSRIWFSAGQKLYCYDLEKNSRVEYPFSGDSTPYQDRFNHLWFASQSGLAQVVNPHRQSYDLPENSPMREKAADQWGNTFYYVDRRGIHWFLNQADELMYFNGDAVHRFQWPDSLAGIQVSTMIQDAHGDYWFAGAGRGLVRWNGSTFDRPIPTDRLPASYVTALFVDRNDRLWIAGLSSFPAFATFKTSHLLKQDYYRQNNYAAPYACLYVDDQETVWMVDSSKTVHRVTDKSNTAVADLHELQSTGFENVHHLTSQSNGLWGIFSDRIFHILPARADSLHSIANYKLPFPLHLLPSLEKFPWPTGQFRRSDQLYRLPALTHVLRDPTKRIYNISAILQDSTAFWVSSYNVGLFHIAGDSVLRFGPGQGLPSLRISALFKDRLNRMWVGTCDQGLFQWRNGRFWQNDQLRSIGRSIYTMRQDPQDGLWIATLDNGLSRLHNDKVVIYRTGLPHPAVWGIGFAPDGTIVMALNQGRFAELSMGRLTIYPAEAILSNRSIRSAFKNQTINYRPHLIEYQKCFSSGLVSWDGQKLTSYTVQDGLPGHEIMDFAPDPCGDFYVATINTGISRFKNGKFETLTDTTLNSISGVTRIESAPDSSLWVLTQDEGLANIKNNRVRRWSDESNLLSFYLTDLHAIAGSLLLTDAHYFYYFAAERLHKLQISAPEIDGYRVAPFFHVDSLYQLWYPSRDNKLNRVSIRPVAPIAKATQCQIESDYYDETSFYSVIERGYQDQACVLEFFGYHSDFPAQSMSYSYRVLTDGQPGDWQPLSTPRLIYTRLQSGVTHIFELVSHAPNGMTSRPARVVIRLAARPIYLQTWFFWLLLTLGSLSLAGWFIYRYYRIKDLIFRRRFNPYIAGEPVLKPEMFYGREKVLRRILGVIHNNNIMIIGERRIGKTSLLLHIKNQLKEPEPLYTFLPIYIDLQGVGQWEFFRAMMHDLVEQSGAPADELGLLIAAKPADYEYREFTRDLRQIIGHFTASCHNTFKLTLLIDEADAMNAYEQSIHAQLRRIFMHDLSVNLAAVIAGTRFIQEWNRPESPWWNLFTLMELAALSKEAALQLIRMPVKGLFQFEEAVVDAILERTECKPYLIQMMCLQLINTALDDKRKKITKRDLDAMISLYPVFYHLLPNKLER